MNGVQLLLVIVGAIAVTGIAQRRGLQPALVITLVGFAASFIPGFTGLELDSEIILGIVLPPLLYSAALNFSFISFLKNLRPIVGLGVGLVVVTALVVGVFASWVVPALTLGTAIVLGAIVAPPDAVTAVAIGTKLGLPKRVMSILTGESLVNDAAALTLFSIAVSAVVGTHTFIDSPVLLFLYSAGVGIGVGLVLGGVATVIRRFLNDPPLETVLGLIVPFAAYLLAEQLEASGVLAVVAAGFTIGATSRRAGYATRLQERDVWSSIDVLLEAFVFAYMGLQLRFVIQDVQEAGGAGSLWQVFGAALLVLLVVLVIRPVWVFASFGRNVVTDRLMRRKMASDERMRARIDRENALRAARGRKPRQFPVFLSWKESVVVSWTGMRGVVTLAAAAGVPLSLADGTPFPGRPEIQAIAFTVAVGTLLVQGLTLPALIRSLKLSDPAQDAIDEEQAAHAQAVARDASSEVFAEFVRNPPASVPPEMVKGVEERVAQRSAAAEREADPATTEFGREMGALQRRVIRAQRLAIIRERDRNLLDDEAAREFLAKLDYQEAAIESRLGDRL
ncbi:cation:proton antiporter [Herbiconiux flava]|uniref:CPA1 family monovalent cation:H+ antiporter n=1 Tax=Herbiconiux flava TaxID=881268 RepID=A0A852SPC9_9MICO|nr:cation:proton antiporter [Herbiconiux flava]NYD70640.1 CPA1 family monovalent cation:H+ antiporter [Herbiconiux flava]GLK17397.1 sodium/hydrogen exchanger [Herbiconiux flava]